MRSFILCLPRCRCQHNISRRHPPWPDEELKPWERGDRVLQAYETINAAPDTLADSFPFTSAQERASWGNY